MIHPQACIHEKLSLIHIFILQKVYIQTNKNNYFATVGDLNATFGRQPTEDVLGAEVELTLV